MCTTRDIFVFKSWRIANSINVRNLVFIPYETIVVTDMHHDPHYITLHEAY
jgi:hypothetical protein